VRLLSFQVPSMLERRLQVFDFERRKNGAQRPLVWDESFSDTTNPGTAGQGE
jgi:hypothetical protein